MKKQIPQKDNSFSLKPFVVLASSMCLAAFVLFFFDEGKEGLKTTSSQGVFVAQKEDQEDSQAKKVRKFSEAKFAAEVSAPERDTSSETFAFSGSSEEEASPVISADLKKRLDEELHSAQDLVDTGEMDSIMKAKEMLEKILAEDPNHDGSLKEVAMIHLYDLDEPVKAQEYLQRSYNLNPEDPLVFAETLQLAEENGSLDHFANDVREKAERNPDNSKIANQLAWTYHKSGDHVRAADTFERNSYKHNSYKDAYSAALEYKKLGDRDSARRMLDSALEFVSLSELSQEEKRIQSDAIKSQMKKL